MRVRTHLFVIAGATLLPIFIFICTVVVVFFQKARDVRLQNLVAESRALSLAVDRDLGAGIAILTSLATSEYLETRNFRKFYTQAKRILKAQTGWEAILLVDPSGQQIVNLRRPFGERLPLFGDPAFIRRVVESRQPAVSNLFIGRIIKTPVISIGVPVVLRGQVKYALTMSLPPTFLQRLLEQQTIPPDGLGTIIDASKIIIARTRDIDKLLGKPSTPRLAARSSENVEGWWPEVPDNSESVYAAHHRSESSGWAVSLSVAQSKVNAPLWQALGVVAAGIVVSMIAAIGLAMLFGRRLVSSVHALAVGAKALGVGETPRLQPSPIVELEHVGSELETAAAKRKRAEEETERNLERIRALHEIGGAITSTLELATILDVLLEKIELVLSVTGALTVRLLNRETGRFGFLACRGVDHNEWNRSRIGAKSRKIVETKTPLAVLSLDADPLTYNREVFRKYGLVSYLGVPLTAKGEVLGVLGIYTNEAHDFGKEEVEFFATLAGQAAIAIHNAQLYEGMVNANKVKDEFLSIMSHEMRTPLSVVTGYVGMLKDRLLGEINPQQEEALQKVFLRAGEQLNMINDVMQTTQLESRLVTVERLPVNLQELFDQLRADYEVRGIKKDVRLVWDNRADAAPLITDRAKLKQILQNLVNNALKFTDKGTVTIMARVTEGNRQEAAGSGRGDRPVAPTRRSSDEMRDSKDEIRDGRRWVEVKVTDTGVGIPKQQLQSVFEKFYQVDSSESRLYEGVGLGLYIVKKFTELLGGQIDVESEVGKGTTFTVAIPCGTD